MIKLSTQTDITVFLPPEFEQREDLPVILETAMNNGARETCSIGPWAKWENSTAQAATDAMRAALASCGLI